MGRYLMLDIGAGTMDILCYDTTNNIHYKAVVCSPTKQLADKININEKNLLLTGYEMGGGAISNALIARAKKQMVLMSKDAAATINHDPEKVYSHGIKIIKKKDIPKYCSNIDFNKFELADVQISRIQKIVEGFGTPFKFDAIAICAQDHGVPPYGTSHLDFRHKQLATSLDKNPSLSALLHEAHRVPRTMNRLCSIAKCAMDLPTKKVYIMDSGMAAILGASMDSTAQSKNRIIVLDIATSHTVGASIKDGILSSFFEYHTKDITPKKLESLIKDLPEGKISYNQILKEGGHGAYTRGNFKYDTVEAIIVTGPMRHIIENCKLPITLGAPWGDNMMTGTTGLMEALRSKENLIPIKYL